MTEEINKLVKYGAVFAIILMLGSAVLVGLTVFGSNDSTNSVAFTFINAKDGVKYLPDGLLSVNIIKIDPDDEIAASLNNSFPGVAFEKMMVGSYESGGLEYYAIKNAGSGNITVPGNPRYENYDDYKIAVTQSNQHVIVGNPLIITTFFNSSNDATLSKKALDVISNKTPGATNLNDILSYADDESNYEEIIAFKANAGSDYDKYYQRASILYNGTLQLEAIILSPNENVKKSVEEFAKIDSENTTITVTENGPALKMYINSTDGPLFVEEMDKLMTLLASHTVQGNLTA